MSSFVPITMFVSLNCPHRLYSYASSQQGYLKMVREDQVATSPLSPFFSSFLANVRISGVIYFHSSFSFLDFSKKSSSSVLYYRSTETMLFIFPLFVFFLC